MGSFVVHGAKKLHGSITTNSAKNSAVALLCASLLSRKPTTLTDLPRIQEVERILEVLTSIGVHAEWHGQRTLRLVPPRHFTIEKINTKAASVTRSALMLLGALSPQLSSFRLPSIGGCRLGERTVRPHIYGLEKLGVHVRQTSSSFFVSRKKIRGTRVVMYESGDTATENVIMVAVLAQGVTVITMASANYQVQDLCHFLVACGAKISGIGTTTLTITGVRRLAQKRPYPIMPDPIESMSFISIAATTNSRMIIRNCPFDFIELELEKMKMMGWKYKILRHHRSKNGAFDLVDLQTFSSKLRALPDKIYGRPYPGLNIDNLAFFVPIATQAAGETLIHDWAYENRAVYFTELNKLGAKVDLADAHRVYVHGPSRLRGRTIDSPPALRPSLIILIAMLAARGRSELRNTYAIERGYERMDERLRSLGAQIVRKE